MILGEMRGFVKENNGFWECEMDIAMKQDAYREIKMPFLLRKKR